MFACIFSLLVESEKGKVISGPHKSSAHAIQLGVTKLICSIMAGEGYIYCSHSKEICPASLSLLMLQYAMPRELRVSTSVAS